MLDAAMEAIKIAEDPALEDDRVLKARSFHTATVYLEVLSSFNALSPGTGEGGGSSGGKFIEDLREAPGWSKTWVVQNLTRGTARCNRK